MVSIRKLYTYNTKKSSQIGGVELVIRQLHSLAADAGFFVTELYNEKCRVEQEKFQLNSKEQKRFRFIPQNIKIVSTYLNAICLCFYFASKKKRLNATLVVFDFRMLYFFPKHYFKDIKIIFLQSTRLDINVGKHSAAILKKRHKLISRLVVYTVLDKNAWLKKFPFLSETKLTPIPCQCRLSICSNAKKSNKNLVAITRISPEKNIEAMIAVMKTLGEDYSLEIYGEGNNDYTSFLMDQASNATNIIFKGATTDIKEVLSDKSVFLMTSHYEGYGQTLIEARSQGLPIVAYNTFDTLSTIVRDGINGHIIEPYDTEAFARSIRAIVEGSNYQIMSNNALNLSKENESSRIKVKWRKLLDSL